MAQPQKFITVGSMTAKKGTKYTSADLPITPSGIDTVKISEAPLIWRKNLNQNGTQIKKDGKPNYIKGNKRGVRIIIKDTTATYINPNVPTLYFEGDEISIGVNNEYTFLNDCTVEYGILS